MGGDNTPLSNALASVLDNISTTSSGTLFGIVAATGIVAVTGFALTFGQAEVKGKAATELLKGTSLKEEEVKEHWEEYDKYFQQNAGEGVDEKQKAPKLVDTFYNLVTDIYEWGWGQSFHFSPAIPGKSHRDATRAHETMIADLLQLKPGQKVLDVGCGVGGPMRAVAQYSQAHVTGITINDYQVKRALHHNEKAGLQELCTVVQGNFLHMPFGKESFDAAYSCEATCHAPKLTEVYREIFDMLKPGGLYVSYEWVKTPKYNKRNPEHVRIVDAICYGDALPEMRTYLEIVDAAKEVGFEVIEERDLALPPAAPWWKRLKMGRLAYYRNHVIVSILSFLGLAPAGTTEVHEMLYKTAISLVEGGETGVFTPMHLLLCRKPEKQESPAAAASA